MAARSIASIGLAAALASSCVTPATEVIAAVYSDFSYGPGADLVSLQVTVRSGGPSGALRDQRSIVLGRAAGQSSLPLSFGVAPIGGDTSRVFWIEVSGCGLLGCMDRPPLVTSRALVGFVPEQTLRLDLFLTQTCRGVPCADANETCSPVTGRCVSAAVATVDLPRFDGGLASPDVVAIDAGAIDVAPPPDAGFDVPAVDVPPVVDVPPAVDVPPVVDAGTPPWSVTAGGAHTCAWRVGAGGVWCFGEGSSGQLGNGTTTTRSTPLAATGLDGAASVAAGAAFTCAVRAGLVYCWGNNMRGQLGVGGTAARSTPTLVAGITDAVEVTAGAQHACARATGGGVWCWGDNPDGQLGNGTRTQSSTPVRVSGLADAVQVVASAGHSCARRAGGAVVCWGKNNEGQVGDGSGDGAVTAPRAVVGLADAARVTASDNFSCAVRAGGQAVCWGRNDRGQLGDGTNTDRPAPRAVAGLADAVDIEAGAAVACARRGSGAVV
ncbi:MAG: regulator of chromosome condensation, partial [Myxococcaceae bacterium]|nr:regulator of chromosome condensation [Myxococcaceae bacterium]